MFQPGDFVVTFSANEEMMIGRVTRLYANKGSPECCLDWYKETKKKNVFCFQEEEEPWLEPTCVLQPVKMQQLKDNMWSLNEDRKTIFTRFLASDFHVGSFVAGLGADNALRVGTVLKAFPRKKGTVYDVQEYTEQADGGFQAPAGAKAHDPWKVDAADLVGVRLKHREREDVFYLESELKLIALGLGVPVRKIKRKRPATSGRTPNAVPKGIPKTEEVKKGEGRGTATVGKQASQPRKRHHQPELEEAAAKIGSKKPKPENGAAAVKRGADEFVIVIDDEEDKDRRATVAPSDEGTCKRAKRAKTKAEQLSDDEEESKTKTAGCAFVAALVPALLFV